MSRSVFIWSAVSFLSAFLLFVVQPMATKAILPILGGSPSVWNTAMVCFQLLLLGGYIYAHLITRIRSPRLQLLTHATLLALSALQLPIAFDHLASGNAVTSPILWTLGTLFIGIGLPFFCLSSTAPLLQRWVTRSHSPLAAEPYRLYSVSNTGSMLALFGYLLVVEPRLDLHEQHHIWSYLYACFALLILYVGLGIHRNAPPSIDTPSAPAPTWRERGQWLGLAFIPSSLMLGVTTYLSTDIASIPLLWVVPLAIYLASFIAAFGRYHAWALRTRHHAYVLVLCFMLCGLGLRFSNILLIIHLLGLTVACFAIHARLAERKPHPSHLTQFYIFLSLGGALGGIFNAIIAPMVFTGTTEYPILLAIACMVLCLRQSLRSRLLAHGWILCLIILGAISATLLWIGLFPSANIPWLFACLAIASCLIALFSTRNEETRKLIVVMMLALPITGYGVATSLTQQKPETVLDIERNFFGTVRVVHDTSLNAHKLIYNTTLHGLQWLAPQRRTETTSYYHHSLGEVLSSLTTPHEHMAIVGLGAGTTQCLATPQQHIDFYDINETVIRVAEDPAYFSFLRDCPGTHRNILGDGRLMLAQAAPQSYGIIVIDAFSSDAIPVHLVTREALASYATKLRKGGVILLHITNRYIDLPPLFARQAESMGWAVYNKKFSTPYKDGVNFNSTWLVLAPEAASLAPLLRTHKGWEAPTPLPHTRAWTDSYSNVLPYFKFSE